MTRAACLLFVAAALAGCGGSGRSERSSSQPARKPPDTGLASRTGPGARVCGFMSVGPYTASDVEMHGLTCPQAATAVKAYLSGRGGTRAHESCMRKHRGAPRGTRAYCFVTMRAAGGWIKFIKGGRHGRRAPRPVVHLEPGDDRDFGREAR